VYHLLSCSKNIIIPKAINPAVKIIAYFFLLGFGRGLTGSVRTVSILAYILVGISVFFETKFIGLCGLAKGLYT